MAKDTMPMTGPTEVGTSPKPLPEDPYGLPDRYAYLGKLGKGGMGEVLLARDKELDREVALKIVHQTGRWTEARFRREAHTQ